MAFKSLVRLSLLGASACCLIAAGQDASDQRNQQVYAQPQQKNASAPKASRSPAAAAPVTDRGVGVAEKVNCNEENDDRRSELCAQWKAVDAAREGLQYSILSIFISSLLGIISTGLLVWTFAETRSVARRELRAYVSAKPGTLHHYRLPDGNQRVRFTYEMRNGGNTPAYELVHMGSAGVMTEQEAERHATRSWGAIPKIGRPTAIVVHGGEHAEGDISPPDPITSAQLKSLHAGEAEFYVFGLVLYLDTFRKQRWTKFCYVLDGNDFVEGERLGIKNPGEPQIMAWHLAPFGNDAT